MLQNPTDADISRSSGLPVVFGDASTGRRLMVVYEEIDSETVYPVTLSIGGRPARILFRGLAPDFTGVYQLNAEVTSGVTPGADVPLVLTVAGLESRVVTIAVR